jgi:hypothetical protein
MGYLNSEEVTVEAVLTSRGREKLANGESLGITKFALSDDEVDYSLWESSHPAGSEFSGNVISNIPMFEAFTEESQSLRYKLITLPRGTVRVPIVSVPSESSTLQPGQQDEIVPFTRNGSNDTLGYTAVVQDNSVVTIGVAAGGQVSTNTGTVPNFLSDNDDLRTQTAVGRKFLITAQTVRPGRSRSTTITIIGNETGGSATVEVTVEGPDE